MKSLSIDRLHYKLNKCILLAQAYTEIDDLYFIFKSCRLKPIDFFKAKTYKTILYRTWIDEFNNSVNISNNKSIKIIYNHGFRYKSEWMI